MPEEFVPSIWVSHSSITDYLRCPRSYFLKNVYRDRKNGRRLTLMQPALALGQAVHEVLEGIAALPADERFREPLPARLDSVWAKFSGKRGGFTNPAEEETFRERGRDMLRRVAEQPGPLRNKALLMPKSGMKLPGLPSYDLSPEDHLVLCGNIDWLEYLPESDSVRIIDFKTGRQEEKPGSLQLPIYLLLVTRCRKKTVSRISYWYLDREEGLVDMELPDLDEAHRQVLEVAREIKALRESRSYPCSRGDGCRACLPYEEIRAGAAEYVYTDWQMKKDVYVLPGEVLAEEVQIEAAY
jgi:ATP-dependent helicase/DNAse subunit B